MKATASSFAAERSNSTEALGTRLDLRGARRWFEVPMRAAVRGRSYAGRPRSCSRSPGHA